MRGQAWYNVSRTCTGGQQRNVKRAHVGECTQSALGRQAMMGTAVGRMFVAGPEVVRK